MAITQIPMKGRLGINIVFQWQRTSWGANLDRNRMFVHESA
jgi:hypothetical protein